MGTPGKHPSLGDLYGHLATPPPALPEVGRVSRAPSQSGHVGSPGHLCGSYTREQPQGRTSLFPFRGPGDSPRCALRAGLAPVKNTETSNWYHFIFKLSSSLFENALSRGIKTPLFKALGCEELSLSRPTGHWVPQVPLGSTSQQPGGRASLGPGTWEVQAQPNHQ